MRKRIHKTMRHILILLFSGLFTLCASLSAAESNISTPNMSFENGNFDNWTRYYSYYGPTGYSTNFDGTFVYSNQRISPDSRATVDATDVWTEAHTTQINTINGSFEVMSSASNDPNVACNNLTQVPNNSKYSACCNFKKAQTSRIWKDFIKTTCR